MESSSNPLVPPMVAEILSEVEGRWTGIAAARDRIYRLRGSPGRETWAQMLVCLHLVVSQLRRVDFALDGAVQPGDRPRARVLVSEWLAGRIPFYDVRKLHSRVDWERVFDHANRLKLVADPVERFSIEYSLPLWAADAIVKNLPEDGAAHLGAALLLPPPRTLRANTLRTTRESLITELRNQGIFAEPTRFAADGVTTPPFSDVFHMDLFHGGGFEAQDEASQLCSEIVAPPPKGVVLDACAGAGGKTLHLAALLKGQGVILAVDAADYKIRDLKERARRAGAHQIRGVAVPESAWSAEVTTFAGKADRILLDAPCSGLGSFRRKPEMRWKITQDDLPRLEQIQRDLLDRAAAHLKPGARLIYSTCTLRPEENEHQITGLLARDATLELVPIKEILGKARAENITDPTGVMLRVFPHVQGTDGFFAAVLRKARQPKS
jgi:16S rRNA (cytosine967-C5)-methyltransferase